MPEKITFQVGRPEYVALRFSEGKAVKGKFNEQMYYSTTDDRAFYLDPDHAYKVEQELKELGIRTGEQFKLTKCKASHGGHFFNVERTGDAGGHNVPRRFEEERAAGALEHAPTAAVASSKGVQHHLQVQPFNSSEIASSVVLDSPITPQTAMLCSAFKSAIDAIGEAQEYARRRGVAYAPTSDNVTSTALSVFIGQQKGGRA